MNTITIELCAEDRARLDKILEALACRTAEKPEPVNQPEAETPVEEVAPVEPEKPTVTLADIQALVQKLAAAGSNKRTAVKQIVNAYATRVSEIPECSWVEAHQKLVALSEEG